jgi:Flp pilus assembly protein TadG
MPSKRWTRRGHRDSGAVAVETSVVSMLLILLLFGIIETSLLLKDWMTVSSAARAGARMGASQPRSATFAQDTANQVTNAITGLNPAKIQEVWVYRASGTTGFPDSGSFASCSVCVKFTWNAGTGALAQSSNNWASTSQNACSGDSLRDSLGVYVKYQHTSPLGFFFTNMTVSESTVMWIEPIVGTAVCKP